ncbi:MAG TPA: hypothetical protein V6C97_14370, partial [Oculatellaceae cyanobacterium]
RSFHLLPLLVSLILLFRFSLQAAESKACYDRMAIVIPSLNWQQLSAQRAALPLEQWSTEHVASFAYDNRLPSLIQVHILFFPYFRGPSLSFFCLSVCLLLCFVVVSLSEVVCVLVLLFFVSRGFFDSLCC